MTQAIPQGMAWFVYSPAHPWQQDALRHTFASYHLRHFRSYAELLLEIGHRDAALLSTRYVDMRGVMGITSYELVKKFQPLRSLGSIGFSIGAASNDHRYTLFQKDLYSSAQNFKYNLKFYTRQHNTLILKAAPQ